MPILQLCTGSMTLLHAVMTYFSGKSVASDVEGMLFYQFSAHFADFHFQMTNWISNLFVISLNALSDVNDFSESLIFVSNLHPDIVKKLLGRKAG